MRFVGQLRGGARSSFVELEMGYRGDLSGWKMVESILEKHRDRASIDIHWDMVLRAAYARNKENPGESLQSASEYSEDQRLLGDCGTYGSFRVSFPLAPQMHSLGI
ncbi:hypothetical protein KM043_007828 [Ampulex compressa]|nr:hypothetical protein KM043_007828 [Ampulex compressa]